MHLPVVKWIVVLFIGGVLADEMITFSSLNVEQGVMTNKVMQVKPSRRVKTARERMASRRVFIPRKFTLQQRSCGEFCIAWFL